MIGDTATLNITSSALVNNTNQGCCGGGLAAFGSAAVVLHNVTLQGNSVPSRQGGAVYLNENANLTASGCVFTANRAEEGGGLFSKGAALSIIISSLFSGNTAKFGGALNLQDRADTTLQSLLVANNSAAIGGGGIAAFGSAALQLVNTSVTQNSARFGGGALLGSTEFQAAQLQASVLDNRAAYNPNLGVATRRITILGSARASGFVSRLGSDAGLLPVTLNVTGLHELPCEVDVAAQLDGANIMVNVSGPDGLAHMNLKLRKPPGLYKLQFQVLNTAGIDMGVPPANMSVEVAPCPLGDVTAAADACLTCPVGYYSFNPNDGVCTPCPVNAQCEGSSILPKPGYWLASRLSSQLHRCMNPAACSLSLPLSPQSSEQEFRQAQCAQGYRGNLCAVCEAGYGRSQPGSCSRCMPWSTLVALYVLAGIALLAFIKAVCYFTLKDAVLRSTSSAAAVAAAVSGASQTAADSLPYVAVASQQANAHVVIQQQVLPTELLKPLILYMQYMLIISTLNIEWQVIWPFHKALGWLWASSSSTTLSVECLLVSSSSVPLPVQKLLLSVSMPLMVLLALLALHAVQAVVTHYKSRVRRADADDQGVGSIGIQASQLSLVVLFFFWPMLSRTVLAMFACMRLDKPVQPPFVAEAVGLWWELDMNQQCLAGYHLTWALAVGVPGVLLVCIVLPAALAAFTWHNRTHVDDSYFQLHYGFLVRSYRKDRAWYEAVVCFQTSAVVAISIFTAQTQIYYQALALTGAFAVMGLLLAVLKPHATHAAGHVALQSMGCLAITSYVALTFLPYGSTQPSLAYVRTAGALLLVLNLAYVASILWKLAWLVNWKQLWQHVSIITRRCCNSSSPSSSHGLVSTWIASLQDAWNQQHAGRRHVDMRSKDSSTVADSDTLGSSRGTGVLVEEPARHATRHRHGPAREGVDGTGLRCEVMP
ncbi:hypothetical protein COO60DRAFT_84981 [Scenedesmus sp. NREL 46B-D3]|nr:hypothetical protein COO60DRAFT_84981 [Scenedesmus sp. NREL 46B-D3]